MSDAIVFMIDLFDSVLPVTEPVHLPQGGTKIHHKWQDDERCDDWRVNGYRWRQGGALPQWSNVKPDDVDSTSPAQNQTSDAATDYESCAMSHSFDDPATYMSGELKKFARVGCDKCSWLFHNVYMGIME
jgi:hypothetical protein